MVEPWEYWSAIYKIERRLWDPQAPTLAEIRKCFEVIASKSTMLPKHWDFWARLEQNGDLFKDFDESKLNFHLENIQSQALSCFYNKELFLISNKKFKNYHSWFVNGYADRVADFFYFDSSTGRIERMLSNPHKKLKHFLHDCKMFSLQPILPKIMKNYLNAVDFFKTIKIDDRIITYAYCLSDINFAIECIEWKLGLAWDDNYLWQFYIKFLKHNNLHLKALNVYSRYCRLFVNEKDMKEEYLREIKRLDNKKVDVTKWWIDYIGIEKNFGSPKLASDILTTLKLKKTNIETSLFYKLIENILLFLQMLFIFFQGWNSNYSIQHLSIDKIDIPRTSFLNIKIEFLKDSAQSKLTNNSLSRFKNPFLTRIQNFSLPPPFIAYIFDSANTELKFTLFKTCRFLFYRGKQILCHHLCVSNECETSFCERSLHLHSKNMDTFNLKSYYITNTLQVKSIDYESAFSKIIERINSNGILYIVLYDQRMTLNEINLLPCHKIETVDLGNVTITDISEKVLDVEDLICLFPNATRKRIETNFFTQESSKKFAKIQFNVKIITLALHGIPLTFEKHDFIEFLKTNVEKDARIYLKFQTTILGGVKAFFSTGIKCVLPSVTVDIVGY